MAHYFQTADPQEHRSNVCILAYSGLALYTIHVRTYQQQLAYGQMGTRAHNHGRRCAQSQFNSNLLGRGEDLFSYTQAAARHTRPPYAAISRTAAGR